MKIIIAAAALAAMATAAQAGNWPPKQAVRCFKDSFGNLRCDDGTSVLHDSWGNPIIIPPPQPRKDR